MSLDVRYKIHNVINSNDQPIVLCCADCTIRVYSLVPNNYYFGDSSQLLSGIG